MKKILFQEKQMLPRLMAGIITVIIVSVLIFSAILVSIDEPESLRWVILIYLVCLIPILILFFIGVEIKIAEDGVYYRIIPFGKKLRFLAKDTIELSYVKGSKGMKSSKYGMKTTGYSKYLLIGDHNIRIKHGKKTITIGTKKPKEFQHFLSHHYYPTT